MLFRAIALSMALLVGIGTLVPLATDSAEAGPRKKRKKQVTKYKKYSKKWWRQYRARQKKKRALQARKRALRLKQLRQARLHRSKKAAAVAGDSGRNATARQRGNSGSQAVLPSGDPAPSGWRATQASPAELQFRVDNSSGAQVGSASIAVVGPAVGETRATGTQRTIGGVATTALRREVIDRMIKENGWVVNDYQKEIGGQQVFVVEAQSQSRNGAVQARTFYFTEVDGRVYSVATSSPVQERERLAEESEKVINSLKSRVRPVQSSTRKD
ncbi:MAG: hypothetical protein KF881_14090 [Acidobacteria bacterium]|nr:hypothetical protein [Acidobacteriota bacterium]